MTAEHPANRPLPTGWVDHPRVAITRRALWVAIGLTLIGIVGAVASVWMRRTQLEKTTEFLGAETIQAIQILPQVTLEIGPVITDSAAEQAGAPWRQIDLTGMPGMGHFRHALLDQRHYDWQRQAAGSIDELLPPSSTTGTLDSAAGERQFARVTFADPLGKFPSGSVRLELSEGWVESADGQRRVPLVDRARPAVQHFLTVLSNAQQAHHDRRLHQDK